MGMHIEEQFVPELEADQLRELHRMLNLGAPKLTGPHGEEMDLPISVYTVLKEIVRNMQMGRVVAIVPERELLTTQTAANVLGCSRPHVIKLMESGDIPFQKVGLHRRVHYQDLMQYQQRRDAARHTALTALAREAVREGYYEGTLLEEGQSDE